jgi:quinol monooxygenase YgiN
LEAVHGKDAEVEAFLQSALAMVRQEAAMTAWFAVRFGRSEYGIVDFFSDDAGRDAHLAGPVAKALIDQVGRLFSEAPQIRKLDVLADKLPTTVIEKPDTKALLLTFKAKAGNEPEVEQFLRDARTLVNQEPDTTAWFAIHLDEGEYGIFDVFPDHGGRFIHLTGHVARELAKHALSLLGSLPDPELPDVISEKLGA